MPRIYSCLTTPTTKVPRCCCLTSTTSGKFRAGDARTTNALRLAALLQAGELAAHQSRWGLLSLWRAAGDRWRGTRGPGAVRLGGGICSLPWPRGDQAVDSRSRFSGWGENRPLQEGSEHGRVDSSAQGHGYLSRRGGHGGRPLAVV